MPKPYNAEGGAAVVLGDFGDREVVPEPMEYIGRVYEALRYLLFLIFRVLHFFCGKHQALQNGTSRS